MLSPDQSTATLSSRVPFPCFQFQAEIQTRKRFFPPEKNMNYPLRKCAGGTHQQIEKKKVKIKVIKPKKCIKPDGSLGKKC